MNLLTILKIAFSIIGSVSVSGVVVWFFVKLASNTLADNYKKKIEHDFEKKLESYKTQIEILKATTLKYNDRQFELYIDLWKSLQNLKFSCLDLWKEVNKKNLLNFQVVLSQTERQIETTSILLEEKHYKELIEIIKNLKEFNNGKEKLYSKLNKTEQLEMDNIIAHNRRKKDKCLEIIEAMKLSIKATIKGEK
jgi:hypothetical protein